MTTAVKRACDACHRRKVKCDGVNPCRNCSSAQLGCTYNAVPQKKGPKGSRAKVISELRETQRQTSLSAKVQHRIQQGNVAPAATAPPTPGLLTNEILKEVFDFYFNHMYSILPILSRERLEQQAVYMDQRLDTYTLLTALSAFVMFQPGMTVPGLSQPSNDPFCLDVHPGANIISGQLLIEETMRVRKGFDYTESPSLNSVCTSYFLYACFHALDYQKKAWYHLREATTLAHMMGMHAEATYSTCDHLDGSRMRRLYWLLFVTERSYALRHGRPLTLQATINLPGPTDDPTEKTQHLAGFLALVGLFHPLDDSLTKQLAKAGENCAPILQSLKSQFQALLPTYGSPQFNDQASNQQYIKNLVWQFANRNDVAFQQFQGDVMKDLMSMAQPLIKNNVDSREPASVEKLVESLITLAAEMTDVLPLLPSPKTSFEEGPRLYLDKIMSCVSMLRVGEHRFVPLLLNYIVDILPRLCNPMLRNAPENAYSIDIFDGLGNAGMAQLPVEDFDQYTREECKTEPSPSGGSVPSTSDLSSPYTHSPPMLTPGMAGQQPLPTEFPPMTEMVMTPMVQPHHQQMYLQGMMGMDQIQGMGNLITPTIPSSVGAVGPNPQLLRQQPQRANSFAIAPPRMGTIGDFHALQRANSDLSQIQGMPIHSLQPELDFSAVRSYPNLHGP